MKFGLTHLSITLWLGSGFLGKSHWSLQSLDNPVWVSSWLWLPLALALPFCWS